MPVADAAQAGDLLYFTLVVSGVIIFILGSLTWWFLKERISLTQRRLNAGNDRFERQETKAERMDNDLVTIRATYVCRDECEEIRDRRDKQHADNSRRLTKIQEHQQEMDRKLSSMCGEIKGGFSTTNGLLAKLIEVENPKG